MTQRTDRIDQLLREEISALLAKEIADPRIGFVTVTDVETAPDLRHARVWVSVIGTDEQRTTALQALGRAMPFIRHELGTRLRIKRIPELHVELDDTAERGTRVLQLLSELEAGHVPDEVAPTGESLPTPVARVPRPGDLVDEPPSAVVPPPEEPRRGRGGRGRPSRPHSGQPGRRPR